MSGFRRNTVDKFPKVTAKRHLNLKKNFDPKPTIFQSRHPIFLCLFCNSFQLHLNEKSINKIGIFIEFPICKFVYLLFISFEKRKIEKIFSFSLQCAIQFEMDLKKYAKVQRLFSSWKICLETVPKKKIHVQVNYELLNERHTTSSQVACCVFNW